MLTENDTPCFAAYKYVLELASIAQNDENMRTTRIMRMRCPHFRFPFFGRGPISRTFKQRMCFSSKSSPPYAFMQEYTHRPSKFILFTIRQGSGSEVG